MTEGEDEKKEEDDDGEKDDDVDWMGEGGGTTRREKMMRRRTGLCARPHTFSRYNQLPSHSTITILVLSIGVASLETSFDLFLWKPLDPYKT